MTQKTSERNAQLSAFAFDQPSFDRADRSFFGIAVGDAIVFSIARKSIKSV